MPIADSITYIRLYKCNEAAYRYANRLHERTEIFSIAQNVISDHVAGDYHSLFISNDHLRITGDLINSAYIKNAVGDYIFSNKNKLLKPILNNEEIMSGKPNDMEDIVFAIRYLRHALTKKYF